jgi:hypothetical protein
MAGSGELRRETTLWESLTGSGGSKDHQFLGDVAAWLVHDLVGIDQALLPHQQDCPLWTVCPRIAR